MSLVFKKATLQNLNKNIKKAFLVFLTMVFVGVVLVPSEVLLQQKHTKTVVAKTKENKSKEAEIDQSDSPSVPSGDAQDYSWDTVEFISNAILYFFNLTSNKESHIFVKQIKLSSLLAFSVIPNAP